MRKEGKFVEPLSISSFEKVFSNATMSRNKNIFPLKSLFSGFFMLSVQIIVPSYGKELVPLPIRWMPI
jgi:hypothetical protein